MNIKKYNVHILLIATIGLSPYAVAEKININPLTAKTKPFAAESPEYSEQLLQLLTAETARLRNLPDIAIENYLTAAQSSNDPKIAKLAVEYAVETKQFAHAKSASMLWAKLSPDEIEPNLIALTLTIDSELELAKNYLTQAINANPIKLNEHLIILYSQLSSKSQEHLKKLLDEIISLESNEHFALLYLAQILVLESDVDSAENFLNQSLAKKADLTPAIQLKAKIIRFKHNNDKPALKYLAQQTSKFPNDTELAIFYSNALLDHKEPKKAERILKKLIDDEKHANLARLALSEALTAQQEYDDAKEILLPVFKIPEYSSSAAYYIAGIEEKLGLTKEAINWYTKVTSGEYHISAFLKASLMSMMEGSYSQALQIVQQASPRNFFEQKHLLLTEIDILSELNNHEVALSLVNNALNAVPTDIDFLYARSSISSVLNYPLPGIEKDLLMILSINPNHAKALNALGYSLSHNPNRHPEAMQYLQQAINISPNNPIFMGSMGWLHFKMGNINESISIFEDAYRVHPNPQIAADFGEVLWNNGNKDKAMHIWQKALDNTPNNTHLKGTLQRLQINLP